jgi:hypothetical protein
MSIYDTNLNKYLRCSHSITGVKVRRINIAVSLENYLYLKGLGKTADSFNKVLTTVLAEHRDKTKGNTVLESGSDLGRDLDQIPTTEGADYNSLAR